MLSHHIKEKLEAQKNELKSFWKNSAPVRHFYIDNLLPEAETRALSEGFPPIGKLVRYSTLRERKSVGVDMDRYHPLIKEITFAFQDPEVLALVGEITGIPRLNPDDKLYSSGISAMKNGDYLNPHIDNSTNPFLKQYRRINALFYVTPGWQPGFGGELELWNAKRENKIELEPLFNRVIFMNTNRTSFHSVKPLGNCGNYVRTCVSNYYFSPLSPEGYDYFHVTSFRGRPENPIQDAVLRMDGAARSLLRKIKPRKASDISHVYKKKEN